MLMRKVYQCRRSGSDFFLSIPPTTYQDPLSIPRPRHVTLGSAGETYALTTKRTWKTQQNSRIESKAAHNLPSPRSLSLRFPLVSPRLRVKTQPSPHKLHNKAQFRMPDAPIPIGFVSQLPNSPRPCTNRHNADQSHTLCVLLSRLRTSASKLSPLLRKLHNKAQFRRTAPQSPIGFVPPTGRFASARAQLCTTPPRNLPPPGDVYLYVLASPKSKRSAVPQRTLK